MTLTVTDLRPDPGAITTVAQLKSALRQYRTWAGNPSYREMAKRCRGRVSKSELNLIVSDNGGRLPRLAYVRDFVGACGADEEYRDQFADAWRRVAMAGQDEPRPGRRRLFRRKAGK